MSKDHIGRFLKEIKKIADLIDQSSIQKMVAILQDVRTRNGRLFILGVGGGAAHASHAVNDFRKLAGIQSYAPTDNVSELTARANDEGWPTVFADWLKTSSLNRKDALLVFSVGGGNIEQNVSANIVEALKLAQKEGAKILGLVGRDGGYTKKVADACVVVPVVNSEAVTAHTESFQAVLWHLIVTHPALNKNKGKWESLSSA